MIVHTLWGWRHGEDLPELMEGWDEFSVDANPSGWDLACSNAIASWGSDLVEHRFVDLSVSESALIDAFEPSKIDANVESCKEEQ